MAPELPIPELLARIKGRIVYMCPKCHRVQLWRCNWRTARRECDDCKRVYDFGIAFADTAGDVLPPFNAVYRKKHHGERLHNRYNSVLEGVPAFGEIVGPVDYYCPKCFERQSRAPTQPECWLRCQRCRELFFVRLLMYSPAPGVRPGMPEDWTMPGLTYDDTLWPDSPLGRMRTHRRRLGGAQPDRTAQDAAARPTDPTGDAR